MKKTLISGITGQDGSYLAELLLSKGYEVHGITRRSSSFNTGRIDHIYQDPHVSDAKVFLHFGDMTDGVGIANLITKLNPDEIYNLAAQSQVRVSFDIPEYTENVVGLGAVRILEAIRHINPKIKYYQASSCFVKGTKILTRKFIERQRYGKKQRFLTLGTKSIEDLIVGDEVLSYNEKTAKKEYKLVERISHRMSDSVFKIKFSNGNFLVASDNHPFFVIGKGWVQLKNLIIGDEVIQKQYNGLYGGIIRQGKSFEDFFGLDKSIVMKSKASISHTGKANPMKNKTYPEGHRIRGIGQHPERAAKHPWNLNLRKETSSKLFEIGQHISISQKKSWHNRTEESKATFIRKVFLSNQKKFNGLEKKISYLLRTVYPGEFKFNGDGRIAILNGKIPDFVNVNGKKKVIEVFCSYWKEKNYDTVDQYMDIRRKEINDQGYDVLFINQKELRDKKKLKDKIKTFIYNPAIDIIKVVSIEFEDKDRMVYNIEVKDNHNFFAKGILVHNSEIFGDSPPPQNELTYMRPNSPYSVAKLSAYWNTVNYRTGYGIFACNGILFNHESPRRGETFVTRKITMAVARIKAGLQKDLFLGNMEAKRDWGYSKNYVVAMFQMMQLDKAEDIVIGTGETHTVREFVEEAFSYVDLDYRDYVKIDPRYYRPNEVNFLQADISKAKRLLNWEPKVKFKELVRLMIDADVELFKN